MRQEKFKAAKFLFDKIKRIYQTFLIPDELDVEIWTEVLDGYSQTEILEALKDYRKNVPYDKAPTPADFKKFLHHSEEVNSQISDAKPEFKAFAPAEDFMARDIALKRCRHNLYIYKRSVDYVIGERLLQEIPASEWRKLKFADKYTVAKNKGLFDDFDDVLVGICRREKGGDYEFESEAMLGENQNFINVAAYSLSEDRKNAWWHN